jgi:CelD/BcsL family acetyltransferase involved in cellulose biosynthesis
MNALPERLPTAAAPPAGECSVEIGFDLDRARPQWTALDDGSLPFQSRAWLEPWFRIVAPHIGASPVLVTVRIAATARPVMFFPLCLRRWRGLRLIEFAGPAVSDYNAPLVADGFDAEAEVLDAIWRRVLRALPSCDLVRLERIPERILGRAIAVARLRGLQPMDLGAWTLELPASFGDYEDRVVTAKVRKENRRKTRRLQDKVGDFVLERARTAQATEAMLEALRRQRAARFGCENILDRPCFLAFYREIVCADPGGFAEMWALKAGERILATQFALRGPQAYLLIMHGFDATIESGSTGIVAIEQAIRRRIELGDRYFDFTIGNESYKLQFGVKRITLYRGLYPVSALGRASIFAHATVKRGLAAVRAIQGSRARLNPAPASASGRMAAAPERQPEQPRSPASPA